MRGGRLFGGDSIHPNHLFGNCVGVVNQQGAICLSVSDNGPGIPEQERERVMERFYRPSGTQASGSGLGLSIVKRIAEIHTAALRIASPDDGTGLRVEVTFKS